MASVKDHYDAHLAPMYTWMRGGAEAPRQQFADFLRDLRIHPIRRGATALDLGAGSGFQTLPLAAAGFDTTAIDLSEILLAELTREAAAAGLTARVHPTLGDMCDVTWHAATPPEVIVCMGDTLTHLASPEQAIRLVTDCATALAPGGHLILSFRDYSTARTGADRFIPVRSDADRIFTCFLEFGPTHLTVHDLVHTRDPATSTWALAVSTLQKVRLSPAVVRAQLLSSGLTLVRDDLTAGLATFVVRKPA